MFGKKWFTKRLVASVLTVCLIMGLLGCSQPDAKSSRRSNAGNSRVSEIAPPASIQELRQALEVYQPQVKILSPRADEVLQDTQVSVRLQVQDLPTFQNKDLEMGPHLHLILDNQPYSAIYDPQEPIVFDNLEPGTHTIRVFASRPWHESFKNEGAYAQTTFHLFTKTPENRPDLSKPLLTYSRPKGSYGAEPVLLDFYISNVPLHLAAQEDEADDIPDWQIRCTVNGDSFTFDRWEPIYLKGLKPGRNWVQMELLDDQGNPFPNAFNNTVRLIDYQPGGQDTLSKLTRGEIPIAIARSIIDPNYKPEPEPEAIEEAEEITPPPLEQAVPEVPIPVPPVIPAPPIPVQPIPVLPKAKALEPVVIEPPVIEPPVIEPPAIEKPVIEAPIAEPPVIKPPIVRPPIIRQPVIKQPVIEQPIIEQPIIEQPIIRQPTIKQPIVEETSPIAPRTSEEVRQRAMDKVDDAAEKIEDTFEELKERSGKITQDTQEFFKRFRQPEETGDVSSNQISSDQQRSKGLLNRFQQPVNTLNDSRTEETPTPVLEP